jgi:hypothetical protein
MLNECCDDDRDCCCCCCIVGIDDEGGCMGAVLVVLPTPVFSCCCDGGFMLPFDSGFRVGGGVGFGGAADETEEVRWWCGGAGAAPVGAGKDARCGGGFWDVEVLLLL